MKRVALAVPAGQIARVVLAGQLDRTVPADQIVPTVPTALEMAVVAVAHPETKVDCQWVHSVGLYQKIAAAASLEMTVVEETQDMIAVGETAAAPVAQMAAGDFADNPVAQMAVAETVAVLVVQMAADHRA